ncbi:Phycocyanin alpha phycocyanobilin lyase [Methanosarcina barkeri str. Wiesmoor]|uniref:Phycocyanin alpha phycocyanobilin lyase n=2 Tax=Methanosarcina barkeri TaxID=2208 RepID=A0A0E3LM03_METBA|nr:HEAT repeat domain-containing protein [Methanosarcina barkeri]AKB52171.1 Phycocyanin alpha phycocyanobilin lyase [Methanosarcina barkeri str. Wiesmoor]
MHMKKRSQFWSCRYTKLLLLLILLSSICAGCLVQDPLEARAEKLVGSLGDEDKDVASASTNALIDIGGPAVTPLIEALKDENPQARSYAALALGEIRDKKAVEPLIEVLDDPSPEVRMNAAYSLGEIGDLKAVEPLIELLKDENGEVVRLTVIALGLLKDPRATEPICEVMDRDDARIRHEDNPDIRQQAVYALAEIGDPGCIDTLLGLLDDKELGYSAANTLGNFKSEDIFEKVTKKLRNSNPTVRTNAIAVFESNRDPAVVPLLIKMLDDKVPEVRKDATFTLGFFKEPEQVAQSEKPLINALGDSNPEVQEGAARSLGRLGSKEAIPSLEGLLQSKNKNLQVAAIEALGDIGDPESVDALIATLEDEDWFVRENIVDSLVEIGDSRAIEPLISLLEDEKYKVRRSAAEGLGKFGDRKAVEPLLKALETEREEEVRRSEVMALGKLGGQQAMEGLSRISTDPDEYKNVRSNAEKALVILKGGGTVNASSFY